MVERKKNESGRRETEKGNKNDFWEICLAPFMFLQRHVSFFGGGAGLLGLKPLDIWGCL